nr:PREDICTED: interferon omega-2-like [Lepisosteus oculatus]
MEVRSSPSRCTFKQRLIEISLQHLDELGEPFSKHCIRDNVLIPFPKDAYTTAVDSQGEIQLVVYETLKSINSLFEKEDTPSTWNQRQLDDFQNIVFRQHHEFKRCMKRNKGRKRLSNSSSGDRTALVKTYFKKMQRVLEEKNYSSCAWEVIRKELRQVLLIILDQFSDGLLNTSR